MDEPVGETFCESSASRQVGSASRLRVSFADFVEGREERTENVIGCRFHVEVICETVTLPFPSSSSSSRDLDCLGMKNWALVTLPVEEVLQTLNDLITYFQLPDAELEHEERQIKLRSLKNRQNLFKQEVSFSMKGRLRELSVISQSVCRSAVQQNTKKAPFKEFDL